MHLIKNRVTVLFNNLEFYIYIYVYRRINVKNLIIIPFFNLTHISKFANLINYKRESSII